MNKFQVIKCVDVKEEGYEGCCVVLACSSGSDFALFFPIAKDNAKIINYVIKDNEYDVNTNILGIYKTMVDSWKSGDRYLSGIIMDAFYSEEAKDEVLMIRLVLADQNGEVDSLVYVNFVHAMLLAAMEKVEVIVSDKLLSKMSPEEKDDKSNHSQKKDETHFPEDKKIVAIAKKIMSGKIKDN